MMGTGAFASVILRDITLAARKGGGWFHAILFFTLFASLAGVAIGPSPNALSAAAPAVLYLGAVFSAQIAIATIFESDFDDGVIHSLAAEQDSLASYFGAKAAVAAIFVAGPIIIVSPVVLAAFGVKSENIAGVILIFSAGAPAILFAALFAAALSMGLRAGGLLASFLSAPFITSPLIFGVMAIDAYVTAGALMSPELLVAIALSLAFAVVLPPFSIAALRYGLE